MNTPNFLRAPTSLACGLLMGSLPLWHTAAQAQDTNNGDTAWRQCAVQTDSHARLACYDKWAHQHQLPATQTAPTASAAAPAVSANAASSVEAQANLKPPAAALAASDNAALAQGGCRNDSYTETSRFWELEAGTDCGTFSFRGYRPLSVSVSGGNNVNNAPTSGNPNNVVQTPENYQKQEMRIQFSVRTKLAQNLLTDPGSKLRDSLWVGYTGLSYWQVFNSDMSRPFRTTDHEPEIFYVYPTTAQLPFGWRWRYSGVGLVHQSNGQSDPLSRSWNRYYLMTGMELDNRWQVQAKLWKRMSESAEDDNNPGIQNYMGRGEVKVGWNVNSNNWLGLTARGSLNGHGKGSGRLEWMRTLGEGWLGGKSNLRLHAQVFSGYGDTLIDYNHKRTVFSVGFSLLDF